MDAAADQEFKPMRKKDGGINGAGSEDRQGNGPIDMMQATSIDNISHISHQEASMGQNNSKYELDGDNFRDKRDSTGLLGVMMASSLNKNKKKKVLKKRNDRDVINESRESVGSFSELVLEQYDKMNLDPKLGFNMETESEQHPDDLPFQEYKPRGPNSPQKRDNGHSSPTKMEPEPQGQR